MTQHRYMQLLVASAMVPGWVICVVLLRYAFDPNLPWTFVITLTSQLVALCWGVLAVFYWVMLPGGRKP